MSRFVRNQFFYFLARKWTNNIFTYDTIWGVTSAAGVSIYIQELYDFYLNNNKYGNGTIEMFKNTQWKRIINKDRDFNTVNKLDIVIKHIDMLQLFLKGIPIY
jgi:hypothetical protein